MTLVRERPVLNLRYTLIYAQYFCITVKVKYYKLNCPDEGLSCEEKVSAHCVPSTVLPSIWYDLDALSHYPKRELQFSLERLKCFVSLWLL